MILVPLSDGCTTYNLTSHQICLKYFPVPARYSSARNLCQAEGGDLIKIDSQEKYDKFETFHGMFKLRTRYFTLLENDTKVYLCHLFTMTKSRLKKDFVRLSVKNNTSNSLVFVFRVSGLYVSFCIINLALVLYQTEVQRLKAYTF